MQGSMLIITPNKEERLIKVHGKPTLALLKEGLDGGSLETVPFFNHLRHAGKMVHNCVAFCDEEGKLKDLPLNTVATDRWQASLLQDGRTLLDRNGQQQDYLVGPIVIVWGDQEFMEEL